MVIKGGELSEVIMPEIDNFRRKMRSLFVNDEEAGIADHRCQASRNSSRCTCVYIACLGYDRGRGGGA